MTPSTNRLRVGAFLAIALINVLHLVVRPSQPWWLTLFSVVVIILSIGVAVKVWRERAS
jgi:hypothetical protein